MCEKVNALCSSSSVEYCQHIFEKVYGSTPFYVNISGKL